MSMNTVGVIFVDFDKERIDYESMADNQAVKRFLESAFGYEPSIMDSKFYSFDGGKLSAFIQKQYDLSKRYIVESRHLPKPLDTSLMLREFEADCLLDDNLVTVNSADKVLGFFTTVYDFEHIIAEL